MQTLLRVAKEISQVFKYESTDVYMISPEDGGPKGKLWNRYNNLRKALHLANTAKKDNPRIETDVSSQGNDEMSISLDFLRVGTEPYIKVLDAWEQTFKLRRKLYVNRNLSEIYKDFPCLSLNRGIELVSAFTYGY